MGFSAEKNDDSYDALVRQIAEECYQTLTPEEIGFIRWRPQTLRFQLTLGRVIRTSYAERFEAAGIPAQRDKMSLDVMRAMLPLMLPEFASVPLCYPLFDYETFCDLAVYNRLGLFPGYRESIGRYYHHLERVAECYAANPYDPETQQEQWVAHRDKAEKDLHAFMTGIAEDFWDFPAVRAHASETYGIDVAYVDEYERYCHKVMVDGRWHGGRILDSRMVYLRSGVQLRGDDFEAIILPLTWFLKDNRGNFEILRDPLFENRDSALVIAAHAGQLLERMPKFQDDYAIVRAAVESHPDAISFASKRLQADPDIVETAARNAVETLIFDNPQMKRYRSSKILVCMAVMANGANLAKATEELRDDETLAGIALRNIRDFAPYAAYECLSDRLKARKDLALTVIRSGFVDIDAFPDQLRDDDDIARALADDSGNRWQLSRMSPRIRAAYGVDPA